MKTLICLLLLPGILLLCVIGCAAALCRLKRLDHWCARQLTDTDASEAEMEAGRFNREDSAGVADLKSSIGNRKS